MSTSGDTASSTTGHSLSKNIIYYGLSIVLMKGLSLIMLPFIAQHLPPEAMGRLELLTTFAIFMSLFVAAGLEDCLFRFASNKPKCESQKIIASLYGWSLVFGAIFYLCAWHLATLLTQQGGDNLHSIQALQLQLVWAGVALEGAITLPLAVMRMKNKAGTFFVIVLGRTFLQAGLTIMLLTHYGTITSILAASLIATLTQASVLAIWQLRTIGIKPVKAQLPQIARYGLPLVLSGLCLFALNGVDRLVIAKWDTLTQLGLYSVAAKFSLATILLMQPFGMWWRPQRFNWLSNRKHECTQVLCAASIILASIAVTVALAAPILVEWLMPTDYALAGLMAVALVAVLAMREGAEIFNLGLLTRTNTYILLAINGCCALFGVLACVYLTSKFGVWGCIVALFVIQALRTISIFITSQHTVRLAIPISLLILLIITSGTVLGISFWLTLYSTGSERLIASIAIWIAFHCLLLTLIYLHYRDRFSLVCRRIDTLMARITRRWVY